MSHEYITPDTDAVDTVHKVLLAAIEAKSQS